MKVPREMGLPSNAAGRVLRCCHGTRDAGALWEETYAQALISMVFRRGRSSPCVFHHAERDLTVVVNGDNFNQEPQPQRASAADADGKASADASE